MHAPLPPSDKPEVEPWFPPHKSRDIYVSLLSLDPPPPRPILVAALLRRAMDDVKLIWSIRDAKTSLTTLLQKGQIGDELWERFLLAEKELEGEIVEVVGEANTFEPGYGQRIFAHASDMVSHERWKEIYRDIPKQREAERECIIVSGSSPLSRKDPNAHVANRIEMLTYHDTEQRVDSGVPNSRVLAPTSYLSPSSLTLSPSNPLPAAGTTPAPSLNTLTSSTPLAANDVTSAPPSRDLTPLPESASASTHGAPAAGPASPGAQPATAQLSAASSTLSPKKPAAATDDATSQAGTGDAAPSIPPVPATKTPSSTPKKTPNSKKGKKKPQVKGGR